MGAYGKVRKWEWLGGMAFVGWGIGVLVKIAEENS